MVSLSIFEYFDYWGLIAITRILAKIWVNAADAQVTFMCGMR